MTWKKDPGERTLRHQKRRGLFTVKIIKYHLWHVDNMAFPKSPILTLALTWRGLWGDVAPEKLEPSPAWPPVEEEEVVVVSWKIQVPEPCPWMDKGPSKFSRTTTSLRRLWKLLSPIDFRNPKYSRVIWASCSFDSFVSPESEEEEAFPRSSQARTASKVRSWVRRSCNKRHRTKSYYYYSRRMPIDMTAVSPRSWGWSDLITTKCHFNCIS